MNPNINRLFEIACQPKRTIIGLMSGTSFDGLDIALCEFTGSGPGTQLNLKQFTTREYTPAFKEELKSVFARSTVNLERVALLNAWIGIYYARLIKECLAEWKVDAGTVDLIASHGQSIFHSPKHQRPKNADVYGNATLQIGDGDHLAVNSGIITISDFRQKNIAAGGEGAPLAVYGDYLLLASKTENRILLNIGGIANFTYLPADSTGNFFSTDVGPGNTLMDQFIQAHYPGQYYDKDSAIGFQGVVNQSLLATLKNHPFFAAPFPKTTGPELFNLLYLTAALAATGQPDLSSYDIMATLAAFSTAQIIDAIEVKVQGRRDFAIYASGGGIYNPQLMQHLREHFGNRLHTTTSLQLNPDAKEAVLFALLANEAVAGQSNGPSPRVSMGKISFPQ
ncbi:anhydro-N-acetylmuramic acid kinase [Puia sp.]|jgi:anhydro-N-acetylmuramic acid kinase|uniref:anhydro-N-acetylmuramic acid kinase n=1 Tax=Puia sp. TaxID=2045100 RepID=UPI002F3F19F1